MKYTLQFESDHPLTFEELSLALLRAAYRSYRESTNNGFLDNLHTEELVVIWPLTSQND